MHPLTHAAEHDQHMTVPQNSSKLAAHANHMPCYHSSNNQCNNASLSLALSLVLKCIENHKMDMAHYVIPAIFEHTDVLRDGGPLHTKSMPALAAHRRCLTFCCFIALVPHRRPL